LATYLHRPENFPTQGGVLSTDPLLVAGGSLEKAQMIAAHESPRTTKLYDRTSDQLSLDEVERVVF
jgi:hypothetical protein